MIQTAPSPAGPPVADVIDNPLREARLNDSSDFRPEWDVPSLNATVSRALLADIDRIIGRREPDPGQLIPVLLSPGGYGKTHLFGRLSHALRDRAFFVFVGAIPDPMRPLEHIRWNVVESLFRAPTGKPTMLAKGLAELFRPSVLEYFRQFPQSESIRHQPMMRELEENGGPVLTIASSVKNMQPFHRLADSAAANMPNLRASVVKALVLGWSPHAHLARRWLRGETLSESEIKLVGLDEDPPQPLQVLQGAAAILQHRIPMVICCDQLDAILGYPEGPGQLANQLMQILAAVPCLYVALSCLTDAWQVMLINQSLEAFRQRTRVFNLDFLTEDQAVTLLAKRLDTWSQRKPGQQSLWPFDRNSVEQYTREKQPTPRVFIKRCAAEFDRWIDGEIQAPIAITAEAVRADKEVLFLREWERELERIRSNPRRTPEHIEEARLYSAIKEAVNLAKMAGGELGAVRVEGFEFEVLSSTPANPKYGMRVQLSANSKPISIILAASKLNGGGRVHPFIQNLLQASENSAGAILVHPRSDFSMGPATRKMYDDAKDAGKLLVYALEDHPGAFESLECMLSLLQQAHSGDLMLETTSISNDECKSLILRTRILANLDLFSALATWNAPSRAALTAGRPKVAVANTRTATRSRVTKTPEPKPASTAAQSTPAPKPEPAQAAILAAGTSRPVILSGSSPEDDDKWAAKRLALAASKLSAWGQQVEPDNYQLGPTFVRLNVKPGAKTTFKKVRERATDLKVTLGLEIEPIIESHSFFFTIDVQRPHRETVTLEQMIAQTPAGKERDPLIPVGVDVSGKSHWLNLADPMDYHFLLGGTSNGGKSVFLQCALAGLAARFTPQQVQFVLIDPKRTTFAAVAGSPFLKNPIATDVESALPLVKQCADETLRRFDMLQKLQKTEIVQLDEASQLPRIVVMVDDCTALVEEKKSAKAFTDNLKKIASMSRASGVHLLLATQSAENTVVPMSLRSSLPGRIAFHMDSEQSAKTVIDSPAAAYLLKRGDLFCKRGGSALRMQGAIVTEEELKRLMKVM